MYGSETDYLSTYLGSIKQMINLEEAKLKQVKDSISLLLDEGKIKIKFLKEKRKEMRLVKEQKLQAFMNLCTDSTNPQLIAMEYEEI
jgi:hypothetical protein